MKKIKNYKKTILKTSILIATILLLAISLNSSFAATVPINNTTPGGINGTITSGTTNPGDTILLAPGNYTGTTNTGITINKNVTIQGNGPAANVIIDAQGSRRIFTIGNNLNVTFINITFTNGRSSTTYTVLGGAIYNQYTTTTMTFINCTFTSNTATTNYGGGAITNFGVMSVSGSTFTNNYASFGGGAISNIGVMSVNDSTFISNSAGNMGGAVIYNHGVNSKISSSTFINNTATSNGGGVIYNHADGANFSISDSTFINNTAIGVGGVICNSGGVNFSVSGSTFINNTAGGGVGSGGAIYNNDNGVNFSVSGSTFINSSGTTGGAIYSSGANGSFSGSSFINNSVTGNGGAIFNSGANGRVDDSNFTNNTANSIGGGAIYNNVNGVNLSVSGSIFTNNSAAATAGSGGAIFNNANNLGVNGSNFINNTAGSVGGGAIANNGNNSIVNYNRIFNNTDTNGFDMVNTGNNVNANLNWWGINNITDKIMGINTSNHYILNITNSSSLDNLNIGDKVNFSLLVLNTTLTNDGVGNLPDFVINGTFDGVAYNSSRADNFTYIFPISSGGNQTVHASLDDQYVNRTFTVIAAIKNSTNSTIVVNPNPAQIGENITVSGQLANYTGIGFVNVTVDGKLFTNVTVDVSGYWELNYTTNRTGTFDIDVSFAGDGNYDAFSNSTTFTVNKNSTNSTIIVNPNPAQIGENITVSGQLANFTGIGFVNVTVDGNLFTNVTVDVSGYWELNYTTNRTGIFDIDVSFAGDSNYDAFSNSTTFTVNKNSTNSTIVVSPNPSQIGENVTVSGQLANFTGIGFVNVTVDGNLFTDVIVDVYGYWELNYTANRTGTDLEIVVSFAGDSNYDAFSNSTTFTVAKNSTNSTIVVSPNPAQIGENVTVSGQLANFTGIGFVNVTVDGNLFTDVIVDVSGYWELNYTSNRTGTDLEIVVSFAGNENYTSFTNTTSFNVTKLAVNSTINIPKDVKVGKIITIDGVLVDENGNPLANAPIAVTVGGKVYSLITDSNGRWSLTYKPTHTGNVNVVVDYTGNDEYFSYTNTTTFNVVKGQVIVDIDVVKNSDGSVDVIVTVSDEYGDPIPDYKVNIGLDGKNIGNIVTNVLGIGRIHIPTNKLSVGHHVITATSDNANYYINPVSAEFEIQNNKNDTNNTNKTSDNPVAIATMKNTGIPIIAIILVLISVFGISIRRKQN
ncbi:beta strand repeat-containing protein [Methanobrevibacter cuticularis]|uniref:beta strand repeat-containing protein n=1 Tax=Methanobrevibacter cuticularis TaxID=47311 RepID=UPI0012EE7836|nr:hypothetical protein [Methanobrevibacter cuticularis]